MHTETLPALFTLSHSPQLVAVAAAENFSQPRILQALATHAVRGERVGVILGNNRLDVRGIARLARQQRLDPRPLLARIDLSRAETCHQLAECIATISIEQQQNWRALYVVGLLETFYDETPAYHEARWLLQQTLLYLKTIVTDGLPVLITLAAPPTAARAQFMHDVAHAVDVYWEAQAETPRLHAPRQVALVWGD
ncbi:MAG: hypothetical protein HY741_09005 [Chloroflexi bacterium]|nr:hypothetical protein [Chloroflexota bacterium]